MAGLTFTLDTSAFARLGNLVGAVGDKVPLAIARALTHAGQKARTEVRRELVGQTGLKYGTMVRAIKGGMSGGAYVIRSSGGEVRLRFFSPRETGKGVTHRSPRRESPIKGAFTKGGGRGHRVPLKMRGAYIRTGSRRLPIKEVRSGVVIPAEMVTGASAAAFQRVAAAELPQRVAHELLRILA